MANVLEKRGVFWWLSWAGGQTDSIDTSVPGAITISEEGQIKLDLEGSLWGEEATAGIPWGEPRWLPDGKRIAGRLGEYGDGGYVLLDFLERTDFSLFPDEKPGHQSYEALHCFSCESSFAKAFDPDRFRELRIELLGLDEWLGLDSIRVEEQFRDGEDTEVKVTYRNHKIPYKTPEANVQVESLVLGVLPFGLLSDLPKNHVDLRQTNWLVYSPTTEYRLGDFQNAYRRVEELIALLLGTHFRLDWPTLVASNGEFDASYRFYFYRGPAQHQLPLSYLWWATFCSVRDSFGTLLHQWQTKAERYGAGYELYVASLRNPPLHPEHRFVNVVWAVESLHRSWRREAAVPEREAERKQCIQQIIGRFSNATDRKAKKWLEGKLKYAYEPTLEERIVEAFCRLPIGLKTSQLRVFARRCAKRRNDISHEGGCRSDGDPSAFRTELQDLTDALVFLFHALLLHEIGISDDQLVAAIVKGGLAEMRILPALRKVGIEMPAVVASE